jgi:hypothetical protein
VTASPIATAVALVAEMTRADGFRDWLVLEDLLDTATDLKTTAACLAQLAVELGSDDPERATRLVRAVALFEAQRHAGVNEEGAT